MSTARISETMGGDAGIEILDHVSPIFDFTPKALRHRIYLIGPGGEGPMQEDYVRQWMADALACDPNTMIFEQVRDVTTKHGGLYCVEFDYTPDSYDQCCELIMQVVTTIKNPRKPRYSGLKVTLLRNLPTRCNFCLTTAFSNPLTPQMPVLKSAPGRCVSHPPSRASTGGISRVHRWPPLEIHAPRAPRPLLEGHAPRAPPWNLHTLPPGEIVSRKDP